MNVQDNMRTLKGFSSLCAADRRCLWHPYTQMKDFETMDPLFVASAKGQFLYDYAGKRYYDTISSWWSNLHGHCHPKIIEALTQQVAQLDHVHFAATTHEPGIKLAQRLVDLTPPALTRVFYSDNGSTACEVAMKMSFQYRLQTEGLEKAKKRHIFVSLDRGYHGDTFGTMSISGTSWYHSSFAPFLFESLRIPSPYCYRCPMACNSTACKLECLAPLEVILNEKGDEVTAVIVEPMLQAAGGMIVQPVHYIVKLEQMLKNAGVHLILDEVATGFGRTGKMFALEHTGLKPDFVCLSKGLTNGTVPLAATLTTEEIYLAFYDDYNKGKTFFHGHTYTGNPLACVCALASLKIFEEEGTLDRVQLLSEHLQQEKNRFLELGVVGDVRGIGMVAAFELVQDKVSKKAFHAKQRLGWQIYLEGLKHGLILRPLGDIIYLFLPFCLTKTDLDEILAKTYFVINKLQEQVNGLKSTEEQRQRKLTSL